MRSAFVVKRNLPCFAFALVLTGSPLYASAGIVQNLVNAAATYFNYPLPESSISPSSKKNSPNNSDSLNYGSGDNKADFSLEKQLLEIVKSEIDQKINSSYHKNLRNTGRLEFEKVETGKIDGHAEIIPEYSDRGLKFKIRYDQHALSNPKNLIRDLAVMYLILISSVNSQEQITGNIFSGKISYSVPNEIGSVHALSELISNARLGSPSAKARWTNIQSLVLKEAELNGYIADRLNVSINYLSEIQNELTLELPKLEAAAIKHSRNQQRAIDQWRSESGALEKLEAMQEKFDDLILKNDRKGVRKLLETYLPWAVMEPVETNAWKIWLDAIEKPDPANMTVAFRGLKYDTDKIQRKRTLNGEIFGFMSTVLTKNQGSYTRRLRSLSTNRVKNGDIGLAEKKSSIPSIKITDQMTSHAQDPKASSFISFTYNPDVAFRFMGQDKNKEVKGQKVYIPYGGLLVVKIDTRRMVPNVSSMYSGEIELLAPLIVFPDEVIAFKEGSFNNNYTYKQFIIDVSEKTGIDFTAWANAKDTNDINLKERYLQEGHGFLQKITHFGNPGNSCSLVFQK
jgi:hypothetical protein